MDDEITSIKKENDRLKLQNAMLAKRSQEKEKDLEANDSYIGKLNSENENLKLENEKLKSEIENVKQRYESSPFKVDKLMALYRCSEKEKYIVSMKLLDKEDNIRDLRNELHSLKNSINTKQVNERAKLETSATQRTKMDHRLVEKEMMSLIEKADKFCEKFEANFEEKRNCILRKLTSCEEQVQVLKESYMQMGQQRKEKFVKWLALCPITDYD